MNRSLVEALDDQQAEVVLEVLLPYPYLEDSCEDIVASIAKRWPKRVIDFLERRQVLKLSGEAPADYDAIPFSVHMLEAPLAAVPELMLEGARRWFHTSPLHFRFDGGRLLASVFPNLSSGLNERLTQLVANGSKEDIGFVLAVLSAYEGNEVVYEHVRSIVGALDINSPLIETAKQVLQESGLIVGEFGLADLLANRKILLEPWLTDERETVRAFAVSYVRDLDQQIAGEVRAAEASIAMRRLNYGEELDQVEGPPTKA